MSMSKFQRTAQPLLAHLQVDASQLEAGNTYELTLNDLHLHLVSLDDEHLTLACNLGSPAAPDPAIAWRLLELNLFSDAYPALQVSAVADSKAVIVWTRERLAQLDGSTLIQLFESFVDRAERLKAWLRTPDTETTSKPARQHKGPASGLSNPLR